MLKRILFLLVLALLLPMTTSAQEDVGEGLTAAQISTEVSDDEGFLTRFLQKRLSAAGRSVDIVGFRGALSSRATFERIVIADADGPWLTLEDGAIQWTRSALLRGRVEIGELSAARIMIPRGPHGSSDDEKNRAEAGSFSLPDLPVGIDIKKINADSVFLGKDMIGEDAMFMVTGSMSLSGGSGAADVIINRTDGKKGNFEFNGSFDKDSRVLNVDLSLDEDANGIFSRIAQIEGRPAVTADIHGEGPLSNYNADIKVMSDGQPRIIGKVSFNDEKDADGNAGSRFELNLGGDIASFLPSDNRGFFGSNTQLFAKGWRASTGRLDLEAFDLATDALKINGRLATNDQNSPQKLDLTVDFGQKAGASSLPVRLPFVNPPITVQSGSLAVFYDAAKGSGWTLKGWLSEINRQGLKLGRLDLDGSGEVVLAEGGALGQVNGRVGFKASNLDLADKKIQRVVGDTISGETGFDYSPGQVLELVNMQLSGKDYGLGGDLTVDGLTSGIVLSSNNLNATHNDLSNLSELAGRKLAGKAKADLAGYFQLLTGAFDAEGTVTGSDLSVDNPQLDHLLQGNSKIEISAGRTSDGTELRDLSINAQRISLKAKGTVTNSKVDLTADFNVPTLADIDTNLAGMLNANARLTGENGSRHVALTGSASGLKTGIMAIDGALAGETRLNAELNEGEGGFRLTSLNLNNNQLEIDGSGTLSGGMLDANLDFIFNDLGALGEKLAGTLKANAKISSEGDQRKIFINGTGQGLSVGQANADGLLRGDTTFSVEAMQKGKVITLTDARLGNEQWSATATGTLGEAGTSAKAHLEVPSFSPMGSGWSGSLNADAVLDEAGDGMRNIRIDAVAQDLAFGQKNVDGVLSGQTNISILADQSVKSGLVMHSLDISNPQLAAQASGQIFDGKASGQIATQIASLTVLGQGWSGSLDAKAQLSTDDNGTQQIEITGTGENIRLGQVQADAALTGTTTIDIAAEREAGGTIKISRANVDNSQLTATAQGEIGKEKTNATGELKVRSLASLGLGFQGALNVDAEFVDTADGARRLSISGTGQNLALGQRGNADKLSGTTNIDIEALERNGNYTIQTAKLTNDQARIIATGTIGSTGVDAQASLEVADLSALGVGMSGSITARATVNDDSTGAHIFALDGTAVDLSLRQAGADQVLTGETRVSIGGNLKNGVISLDKAQISNPKLKGEASGVYGGDKTDLNASLKALDLGFLGGGFGGMINMQVMIKDDQDGRAYDVAGNAQDLRVGNLQANAALAGETQIKFLAVQAGERINVKQLMVENQQINISGSGVLGSTEDSFEISTSSRDLSFLGSKFAGSVDAKAILQGFGKDLKFNVTGKGSDLAVGVAQLDGALNGETRFSASGRREGALIRLDEAQVSNSHLNSTASGTYGGNQTDIQAELKVPSIRFAGPAYRGNLNVTARVQDKADGRQITANVTANGLGIGNDRVDGLLAGQTTADIDVIQSPGGLRVKKLNARNPQIQALADGLLSDGINVDLRLADLSTIQPGFSGPAQAIGMIKQVDGGAELDISVTAPGGTRAQLVGVFAGETTDLRVSGISDAAAANPFLRTRSLAGPVNFDLQMQGKPGLNALRGTVNMPHGRLAEPRIGLSIDDLRLNAELEQGLINVDINGGLNSGGRIGVTGAVDLRTGKPVLDLTARLDNAVIYDPSLYKLTANGVVSVSGIASDGPLVSGKIDIAEAEFRIPSTGLGGAHDIPDIKHINDNWRAAATRAKAGIEPYGSSAAQAAALAGPAATPPPNPARFNLTINAPNQIFIRGRGVDAELGGTMQLNGNARQPIPIGHLSLIRGRVDLLGKRFDLSDGLIEMQGSLIPIIRLVATHAKDDITIRIVIDGEVRDPDITFESDPSLPEEEVLSYLLFGQGLDQITPLQAAQLANALAVLAGKGGIGVIGNIREATGLDDLDTTVDEDGSVSVRAGKYLTRNAYTDLELDDEGKTQINLNLDVTDALTARGSVDSRGDSTIGLYYERDY